MARPHEYEGIEYDEMADYGSKGGAVSDGGWLGWVFGGLLMVALVMLGVSLVGTRDDGATRTTQVAENPANFYGQSVNLTGEVDDIYGVQAFSLDGTGIVNDKVLVISRNALIPVGGAGDDYLYDTGDRVQVQGTVRSFQIDDIERDLGIDLVDSMFMGWEGKPVVIAEIVDTAK